MILIHDKATRGHTRTGWLDSHHTFSFGSFSDPARMGFGNLRVVNEDHLIPNSGFPMHRHEDMDILTLVLGGRIRHEDSAGNRAEIGAGEIQHMYAGDGVEHSEWNASDSETAHVLQIWLIPDATGGASSYDQAEVPEGGDVLLGGPEGSGALVRLHSDTTLRLLRVGEGETTELVAREGEQVFAQIIDGLAHAEGERVSAGDGLQLAMGEETRLDWNTEGSVLLFTMPTRRRARVN